MGWVVSWTSTFHGKPFLLERITKLFWVGYLVDIFLKMNEVSLLLQGKQQFAAKDKMSSNEN